MSHLPNPLFSDLQDEITQELIESGNLKKRKQEHAPFVPVWTHLGYVAKVQHLLCECGVLTELLMGIFSREVGAKGEKRDLLLSPKAQIPLNQNWPIEIEESFPLTCAHCLPFKGFSLPIFKE